MADTFQLELVSPERLLLSRQVEMAVIPSAEGEMGVLPGHAPMIVALRGGVISVRENGAESERLFVAGGFAEVLPDRVTVLADEATPVADVSRAEAERRLSAAEVGARRGDVGRHGGAARPGDGAGAIRARHARGGRGGLTGGARAPRIAVLWRGGNAARPSFRHPASCLEQDRCGPKMAGAHAGLSAPNRKLKQFE